jgi:DNA-binding HxlR family transcriptional regulator
MVHTLSVGLKGTARYGRENNSVAQLLCPYGEFWGPGTIAKRKGASRAMASWLGDAQAVIDVISRKWAVQVLDALAVGPRRHNELLRAVNNGIHPSVMDDTLSHLDQAGLVQRHTTATTPPAAWYQLTDLGESLLGQVAALARWADEHRPELNALPGWPGR